MIAFGTNTDNIRAIFTEMFAVNHVILKVLAYYDRQKFKAIKVKSIKTTEKTNGTGLI